MSSSRVRFSLHISAHRGEERRKGGRKATKYKGGEEERSTGMGGEEKKGGAYVE